MDNTLFRETYGPWALIAGASEGVGAAFSRQLAALGLNVVLVARRKEPLTSLSEEIISDFGVEVRTASIDLSARNATEKMLEATKNIEVHLFVYNAGAATDGSHFLEMSEDHRNSLLALNVNTLQSSCHAYASTMKQKGRGALVLTSSRAALGGASRVSMYSATKAFGLNLGESLWAELKHEGVDVLNLILGSTDTPNLRQTLSAAGIEAEHLPLINPEEAVQAALQNLKHGPSLIFGPNESPTDELFSNDTRRQRTMETTAMLDQFYGSGK